MEVWISAEGKASAKGFGTTAATFLEARKLRLRWHLAWLEASRVSGRPITREKLSEVDGRGRMSEDRPVAKVRERGRRAINGVGDNGHGILHDSLFPRLIVGIILR